MRLLVLTIVALACFPAATIGARNQTATLRDRTDAAGRTTTITVPGTVEITVLKSGFAPATAFVQVAAGATQELVVEIQPPNVEETVTVVASTRTDKRLGIARSLLTSQAADRCPLSIHRHGPCVVNPS